MYLIFIGEFFRKISKDISKVHKKVMENFWGKNQIVPHFLTIFFGLKKLGIYDKIF
jgi:hypothetical protein